MSKLPAASLSNESLSGRRHSLVLASTSPYRRELLARLRLPFDVVSPDVDEKALAGEAPEQTALRLSEAKARAAAERYPTALIIGSDQVAHIGSRTYGKPMTHANAVLQLTEMSGRTIVFSTGLCLLDAATGRADLRLVDTTVSFRELSAARIENYLRLEQPYNCAGSAKSEGLGISLIARIDGDDPNALVGLPLIALCDLLALHGVFAV